MLIIAFFHIAFTQHCCFKETATCNTNLTDHDTLRKLHLPQPQDSSSLEKELSRLPKGDHICLTKEICKPTTQSENDKTKEIHKI